ncbi:calcineurin-like phosphoesterase C-terminal domain-containing protein [Corynebacterium kalidii]|uniref:Calcineurin-like phosphoesterase C-terminal domain-containing protein n=1 Tax=Corynebacterium kalidii TaxID=2931982 RepID=A0A9X1WMZ6_9CORY|nr:calcineurin-like phosphoesterase family protein [Corynebacterium kalidii]MCJ7859622.1 calcineurin-like phosphoesterase C-terminal domain-containing protein [Corynebacterium kalidii]
MPRRPRPTPILSALSVLSSLSLITVLTAAPATAVPGSSGSSGVPEIPGSSGAAAPERYEGSVEVVDGAAEDQEVITGQVFDDTDRDSSLGTTEPGVAGVRVSNGVDVVTTDADGRYSLPARDNMSVFVTQPAGWQVPVDASNFAQFSYEHYPEGSPDLTYGGLEPTGPVPTAVNFPLVASETTGRPDQSCAIAADTQTYDRTELGYAARGVPADLAARDDYAGCGVLLLGDNVGDDLSLNQDMKQLYADANGPVRALPGNHDIDYDAADDTNSTDTYRRDFGAPYYSYDVGDVHVVALDNIVYHGDDGTGNGGYDEKISAEQLTWLRNDLATVDDDTRVVVAAHAPIVNYTEVVTDNAAELYEILADRPDAVTVGGHTHTRESLLAGERRAEWADHDQSPVQQLPHDQFVAGAVSGDWYSGELNANGLPHAYTQDAAEPGVLTLQFTGTDLREYYTVRNEEPTHQFLTGINSPTWRTWAADARRGQDADKAGEAPAAIDPLDVPVADLAGGDSYLTTSFFNGSTDATVSVRIDDGEELEAKLTQPAQGEALNKGWEYTETVSATHNLRSTGNVAQASPHVWRLALPSDLEVGPHTAEVTGTDRHGREFTETVEFTVTG